MNYLVVILLSASCCFAQKTPVQYVNPYIGSAPAATESARRHSEGASELRGQISPVIGFPHGMTTWTPQTRSTETKCVAPYYFNDPKINGFRASHWLNGSCVQDYGSLAVMPLSGKLVVAAEERASRFTHEQEIITPAYYAVELLDSKIKAELTATQRAGFLRFHYRKNEAAFIVIQPNSDEGEGYVELFPERNEAVVYNPVHRIYQGAGQPAGFSGFYVLHFEKPFKSYGTFKSNAVQQSERQVKGNGGRESVGAYVEFEANENLVINVRIGSSFTDIEGARRNLMAELPHGDFDRVVNSAEQAWNRELGKVQVQGKEKDKTVFYTALYHSKHTPRLFSDVDGRYPGFADDAQIHTAQGFDYYCDFSLWDTFRAAMPLHALLEPKRTAHLMQSLTQKAEQGGWMPIFPCWNHYTAAMIGDHVTSVMADAYTKGIRSFDVEKAYSFLRKNAFVANPDPKSYASGKGRRGMESYLKYNYIPLEDSVWQAFHKREQTSRTLEYAYDDFCLSTLAKALGKKADEKALKVRSFNYQKVIDPQTGWARGRYADGRWSTDFDPFITRASFITEGSPAQYTWFVPHDVGGLMKIMGGKERFVSKLDSMFEKGYYWHGNEPGNHTAYLYAYAGAPWKTQRWVRQLIREEYTAEPGGLSGNEDGGQMSSWLVFSMMGFYPVCPGKPYYILGSPSFNDLSLTMPGGKLFRLIASDNSPENCYIQSAELNGKTITKPYLTHQQLTEGGTLRLKMGPLPNTAWGTSAPELSSNF